MGTKLTIKGKRDIIDLPRGAVIPREGDSVVVTLKGEKKERICTVHLIEHTYNFNIALPLGNTEITLKEVKLKGSNYTTKKGE